MNYFTFIIFLLGITPSFANLPQGMIQISQQRHQAMVGLTPPAPLSHPHQQSMGAPPPQQKPQAMVGLTPPPPLSHHQQQNMVPQQKPQGLTPPSYHHQPNMGVPQHQHHNKGLTPPSPTPPQNIAAPQQKPQGIVGLTPPSSSHHHHHNRGDHHHRHHGRGFIPLTPPPNMGFFPYEQQDIEIYPNYQPGFSPPRYLPPVYPPITIIPQRRHHGINIQSGKLTFMNGIMSCLWNGCPSKEEAGAYLFVRVKDPRTREMTFYAAVDPSKDMGIQSENISKLAANVGIFVSSPASLEGLRASFRMIPNKFVQFSIQRGQTIEGQRSYPLVEIISLQKRK